MNIKGVGIPALVAVLLAGAGSVRAADIEPGLYLRTNYAFGNLALSTIFVGAGNRIAIDPKGGVDGFDFDAAAKASPSTVGVFKVEGNKIAVTWTGAAKPQVLEIEFEKGVLSAYDGGLVTKADAYAKDQKLNATFAGGGQTANVSSSRTIAFSADGTYSMTTVGGVRNVGGNNGQAQKTEKGTYTLSGNTLTLTPAGGTASKHTVLPFSTALDPKKAVIGDDHMIFDGQNLKRGK